MIREEAFGSSAVRLFASLLGALLGTGAGLQPLRQLLIARTEGNPFFLEESVWTLVETQVLAGERGAYRLAKALPGIQVPATVQAVLAARIDRLPPEEKHFLQTAAVIGKDVPFSLLRAIAELPEEALGKALAHLQAPEFLYETSLFPDLEYTFKHALTHEVAYASLLHERRRALHAGITEAIERLYPERLGQQAERVVGDLDRAVVMGQRALAFAAALGDLSLQFQTGYRLGGAYQSLGDYRQATDILRRTVESLRGEMVRQSFGLPFLPSVIARTYLAWCLAEQGEFDEGMAHGEDGLRIAHARKHKERGHEAWSLRLLGQVESHSDPPKIEDAEAYYRQALAPAEELGMRPLQAHCHFGLGTPYRKVGRPGQARAELTTVIEMFRSMDMTFWLPRAEAELAQAT